MPTLSTRPNLVEADNSISLSMSVIGLRAALLSFLSIPLTTADPLLGCPGNDTVIVIASKNINIPNGTEGTLFPAEEFYVPSRHDSRIFDGEIELWQYFELATGCTIMVRPFLTFGDPGKGTGLFGSIAR